MAGSFYDDDKFDGAKGEIFNRDPAYPGEHIVQILDIYEATGYKGYRFQIDFRVLESGHPCTPVGFEHCFMSQPQKVDEDKQHLEFGKIKRQVGAAMGFDAKASGALKGPDIKKACRGTEKHSNLRGRLVRLKVNEGTKPMKSNPERKSVFYEMVPYLEGGNVVVREVEASGIDAPATTTSSTSNVLPFPPPGWAAHPTAPGFYYCGQEVLNEQQLRAKAA
jgi:hypothetical protein